MFAKPVAGGGYFKPADHVNDLAILLEPTRIERDVENDYDGVKSLRDEATVNMAIFKNSHDIETSTPSVVLKGVKVVSTVLVAEIDRNDWVGKSALVVIRKPKRAYIYAEPEYPGAETAAVNYYKRREAEDAADDFPFDDDEAA